jgi:hypothetical protein
MRTRIMLLVGVTALALGLAACGGDDEPEEAAPAPAETADTGLVTVVHGVPGLTVDVYVNDELTLEAFEPGTVTDPLELPAGDYEIAVREAGADAASEPAILGSAALEAGANVSIAAHLDADGTPTLSVFANDLTAPADGEGRVIVRHTAAAPAVDVLADESALIENLANPDEAAAEVAAGTYSVAVALAGTTDPVLGPADVEVADGQATIVYATGSAAEGTLGLAVQTIDLTA